MLAACLLRNIDIAVVSECLCHLRAKDPVQSPDISATVGKILLSISCEGEVYYNLLQTYMISVSEN